MSHEHYRRGRNWFTVMGILFCFVAGTVLIQQLRIWGIEFVGDFLFNDVLTNEKIAVGTLCFGIFMIVLGFRKHESKR